MGAVGQGFVRGVIQAGMYLAYRPKVIYKNKKAMKDIKERFREIYQKGYASQRYSDENKMFLTLFCINPEITMLYWKIKGKVVKK